VNIESIIPKKTFNINLDELDILILFKV
jgi:hypothetical protein